MPETVLPGGHRAIPIAALTPGRGQRATWIVAVTVSLSIAVFVVFGVGSSTTHCGEDSPLAQKYTQNSGADFTFYWAQCSATAGPTHVIQACANDSYVVDTGPVGPDSVDGWVQRLREGRQIFVDLGLADVTVFETPHYLAPSNAYAAMGEVFEYRYERSHYFPGQLTGTVAPYQRCNGSILPLHGARH